LIFSEAVFELKKGVVLCVGILGTLDIELKSRVVILKTPKN